MHVLALLGQREREHLDLGELVHAIQAARGPAGRARLGAETVADAAQLDRQLLGLDDLPCIQAAERDLGRGHQIQVMILDAVDLRLRPAGNEADALKHVAAGQIGRHHRREAFAHQEVPSRTAAAPTPKGPLPS